MTSDKRLVVDDLESWSEMAIDLCKLKMACEYAQDFRRRCSKYMTKEDKVEMAKMNTRYDVMYWKYWEKLVKKIRGF
jgi:hypothetical protein